ncbi:MAG TPA: LEA type 2 family protein [Burkholderiales bacterium]|nr:LEA type 2 family protein [Burkholderiales bacterium]
MKTKRRRVALLVAGAAVLAGCAHDAGPKVEPLRVSLVSMEATEMGVLEQRYALKIRVQNPRPQDVPLAGVSFDLDVNGSRFARGTARISTVVPAFGDVVIDATAISTLPDVISRVQDLQNTAGGTIRYRMAGRLYTSVEGAYERFNYGGTVRFGP